MKGVLPRSRTCLRALSPPWRLYGSARRKTGSSKEPRVFPPVFSDETPKTSPRSPLKSAGLSDPDSWEAPTGPGKPAAPSHSFTCYAKASCTACNQFLRVGRCVASLDPEYFKNTTVIEVNPGPGFLTRAMFNQINPSNYILMDSRLRFKPALQPLTKASNGVIKHFDLDGWDWAAYNELIKRKLIDPEIQPPSKVNSSLILVGNFTESGSDRAESLISQLLSFMYNSTFLYNFGRIKTLLWVQSPVWQHLFAPVGHPDRKKISVIRELTCDARVVAATQLADPGEGPRPRAGSQWLKMNYTRHIVRISPRDFSPPTRGALIELTPLKRMKTNAPIEELDYLTLKMFTVPKANLKRAMKVVGPGAEILLKSIGPYNPALSASTLLPEQWVKLANAFHNWPFKPDVLEDESYLPDDFKDDLYARMVPDDIPPEVFAALGEEAEDPDDAALVESENYGEETEDEVVEEDVNEEDEIEHEENEHVKSRA